VTFEQRYLCRDGVMRTLKEIEARAERQRGAAGPVRGQRLLTGILDEAGSTSGPQLPEGWVVDPNVEQIGAEHGYWWVVHEDGSRTAWQENPMKCPVCKANPDEMPDCAECVGRGHVDHIPFCPNPWDEVFPNLWVGGHDCMPSDARPKGECRLSDTWAEEWFDVVISLYHPKKFDLETLRWAPDDSFLPPDVTPVGNYVEHYYLRIADAELDPDAHTALDDLAEAAYEHILEGKKVLIRCQAGLNRSSLVAALTLMQMGSSAGAAIEQIRSVRSPYVLCNQSFVDYLLQKGTTL
jgi:protein-tyrosine phosphatase